LRHLKGVLEKNGIESLLFTSDSPKNTFDYGSLEGGKVNKVKSYIILN